MSCNFYLHNDPVGGTKYISGTTCSGTQAYYYLTIGQEVCMNSDLPLINLNNLQVGDTCFPVTPTPSTTPYEYCYFSAVTYYTAPYQCPNDGEIYEDIYGKMTFYATIGGRIVSAHPDLSFVITNGTDYETVTILDGQEFIEFIYPRVNFYYTETGCEEVILPDWTVYTPPVTNCLLFTPTPTATPTVTPTNTQTQTPTPSTTPYPACPEQLEFFYSGTTPEYSAFTGTYQRAYAYTGGTMVGGYMDIDSITDVYTFISGADPSGKLAAIYTRVSGSTYYTIIPFTIDSGNMISYAIYQTNTNYIFNGQQPLPIAIGLDGISISPNVGGVYYPRPGDNEPTNEEIKLITYPIVCPTPTPTNSSTPTQTPTNTATNTSTPTPTTPLFSPNNIPDLFQWFDAASGSTLTTSVSGGTTYVNSWSGRVGNVISQANASRRPKYIQSLNSFPYSGVSFEGTSINLSGTTSGTTPSGNTTFIVSYNQSDVNSLQFQIDTNNGEGVSSQYTNIDIVEARTPGRKVAFANWSFRFNYPKSFLWVSGNSISAGGQLNGTSPSDTTGTFTAGANMTGIRMSDVSADSQGAIYEILVYNRVLNTSEINLVKTYLEEKWNYGSWQLTPTPSITPSQTATPTQTLTNTLSPTQTQTPTNTATKTPTPTRTPAPVTYNYVIDSYVDSSCSSFSRETRALNIALADGISAFYCNPTTGKKFRVFEPGPAGSYSSLNVSSWIGPYTSCSTLPCP